MSVRSVRAASPVEYLIRGCGGAGRCWAPSTLAAPSRRRYDAIAQHLNDGRGADAQAIALEVLNATASASAIQQEAICTALLERAKDPHPAVGAQFAIMAGALMEGDHLDPARVALALVGPVARAVDAARRFVALARECPDEGTSDGSMEVAHRTLSLATLQRLAKQDGAAAAAFSSLDVWYRPAAASWTRAPDVLRAMQQNAHFREALAACEQANAGAHWLSLLVGVAFDAPFVVLVPEIEQAWAIHVDGVCDMGQLAVLASHALHAPLAAIGAPAIASEAVLAVMRGDGPQCGEGSFSAAFHFYPWQAIDPSTGFPADKRFTWSAPGGVGDISLPGDFQPASVRPLEGVRILALVGPNAKGTTRFTRVLSAVRTFSGLRARVDGVRRLAADEAARWRQRVVSALAS